MSRVTLVHTAQSNVDIFQAMAGDVPFEVIHIVRDDLLTRAEEAGGLTDQIRDETRDAVMAATAGADAVLLTCSTVGPGGDAAALISDKPVLRVDRALAEAATAGGGKVAVLCAVETTVEPTRALFDAVSEGTGATVSMHLVPGAWDKFRAGDPAGYAQTVADAADQMADEFDVIALAQASMAPAADLCVRAKPLTSPQMGLAAIAKLLG